MIRTDYEKCTGCGACVQCCPKGCIRWEREEFGFLYPHVNETECIDCHLCEKVCPINRTHQQTEDQEIYALVNKNNEILQNSTSGGAFSAIAMEALRSNGVVYGCAMSEDFRVTHIRISKDGQLSKLQGSKYVQSDTADTYTQVKEDLKNGLYVVYSGTPCQIAGLNGYLGKDYERLLTVDIVCHGVGSQSYFDKFVEYLKIKKPGLKAVEFRNKKYAGWSCNGIMVVGGKQEPFYNHEYYYYSYFLSGEIYRKSCYTCTYANMNRVGDITLGDFWGVESINAGIEVSDGCSLVIANTEKGKDTISKLSESTAYHSVNAESAIKNNEQLSKPSTYKESRIDRITEYEKLSGEEIQEKYIKTHRDRLIKGKLKTMLPYSLKAKLRKIM